MDISEYEEFAPENRVIKTKVYMTFETKDGRFFDIEMTQATKCSWYEDWHDYYPEEREYI